jgi:integrase
MIDEREGTIKPEGGRKKSGVEQVSPVTARSRAIFQQIKADKKSGAIVPNLSGLVFTLNDGTRITKGLVHYQVEKALKKTGVKKFVFHNLRNTALTTWARQGIPRRCRDESERPRLGPDAQAMLRSPSQRRCQHVWDLAN